MECPVCAEPMALTWKGTPLKNRLRGELARRGFLRRLLSPKPAWGCVNLACAGCALRR